MGEVRQQLVPIGRRVRVLREKRGQTQETLAQLLGHSERWMVDVEAGRVDLKLTDLTALADMLGAPVADLITGGITRLESVAPLPPSWRARAAAARMARAPAHDTRWGTQIGAVWFPWVVAGYGPYRHELIESFFHSGEPGYPDEVEEAFRTVHEDVRLRSLRGEEVPYDSDDYKLIRFHVSSRTHRDEEPKLVLHFAPTTYYRMLATDQRLDIPHTSGGRTSTLRERYAGDVDLRVAPVPEFATHWGVGLSVITADGRLLISERGNTAVDPHVMFPSVAEGATRAKDGREDGTPDHFSTAARGMIEELGVSLEPAELTWLSFGANSFLCEYGLVGRVDSTFTADQIEQRRAAGAAKDSWETRRLHAVDFVPEDVVEFCSHPERRFSAFAMIAIVHALMSEYGVVKTESAFRTAKVAVSQHLPGWLVHGEANS